MASRWDKFLVGTYAFSQEGFQRRNHANGSLGAYSENSGVYTQEKGLTVEAAVGYMTFGGDRTLKGEIKFVKPDGLVSGQKFDGTYVVDAPVSGPQLISGRIKTVPPSSADGPGVDYYFVAADGWRELRLLVTKLVPKSVSDPTVRRPFFSTVTMRKL